MGGQGGAHAPYALLAARAGSAVTREGRYRPLRVQLRCPACSAPSWRWARPSRGGARRTYAWELQQASKNLNKTSGSKRKKTVEKDHACKMAKALGS
jgi:hypothetical protein